MAITNVLAVVPVSDLDAALAWYERLFGAPPTNIPMPGLLAEWRLTDSGWLQLTLDADRAGTGLFNLAVDDVDEHLRKLADRGLDSETTEASKNVRLAPFQDPDGNTITLIGNFRVDY